MTEFNLVFFVRVHKKEVNAVGLKKSLCALCHQYY